MGGGVKGILATAGLNLAKNRDLVMEAVSKLDRNTMGCNRAVLLNENSALVIS